jgi:hypothetical protein
MPIRKLLLGAAAILTVATPSLAVDGDLGTWGKTSSYRCSDVISPGGTLNDVKAHIMMLWLSGYRDGIAALAGLDKRLGVALPYDQLVALVLVYCRNKQDQSVGEAVTGAFEMTLNALPLPPKGHVATFDLVVPK